LAARTIEKLNEVARECEKLGAECLSISTDVSRAEDVQLLADEAINHWGQLDVWINNAGVGAIGSFTEVPLREHQQVLETNLFGYLHGAHAALKVFKRQKRGVLINNASVCSRLVTPYLASYNASKFAIRGLTHSLRQDLAVEGLKDVHVCQINPGVIDTPAFQSAGNYSGKPLRIRIPMTKPETVARKIVSLVERPRREVFVGPLTGIGSLAYTLLPAVTGAFLVWGMKRLYFNAEGNQPAKAGNVLHPSPSETFN
jgi:short-subunit dehydrogenase